jgi:hypothetical protein
MQMASTQMRTSLLLLRNRSRPLYRFSRTSRFGFNVSLPRKGGFLDLSARYVRTKSLNIVKARSRWPRLLCRNSSNCSVRDLVVSSTVTSYRGKPGPHSYESASYRRSLRCEDSSDCASSRSSSGSSWLPLLITRMRIWLSGRLVYLCLKGWQITRNFLKSSSGGVVVVVGGLKVGSFLRFSGTGIARSSSDSSASENVLFSFDGGVD